ncbi:MAG: DNA polymerase/3'-5' exonuclease PolX [Dongiaceae bacterium]
MPVPNAEIAADLVRLADLLELDGANPFRVRAYRNAARVVGDLPTSVAEMLAAGADLAALPGIGADLAGKIAEIARSGHLALLDETERRSPPGLVELLAVPGLGPRRVQLLAGRLGVRTVADLAAAARAGRSRTLPGFGARLESRLLQAAERQAAAPHRARRAAVEEIAGALRRDLAAVPGVAAIEVAGSYRRRLETVGDLDLVAAARSSGPLMERFVAWPGVERVLSRGPTRSSVLLRGGLQVDLRVVPAASYGAALQYFTGSKAHNIALRQRAAERGLKLNEYGLFRGRRRIAGGSEDGIYRALALDPVVPELREDRGEIAAAAAHALPALVAPEDIRGDLHVHTDASDGRAPLAAMVAAARALGYRYMAVTDHSRRLAMLHGLDSRRLGRQADAIARLNEQLRGFTVLAGVEVDILEDGRLDLPDAVLGRLDLVVGAVHGAFALPRERQTERLIRAMDNPHLSILAHPTGRLIGRRAPLALDIERLLHAAGERGCALEVNGQPERLDLDDRLVRLARDRGVRLALSTDAHSPAELGFMRHAVDQARRGWARAADIVNTRDCEGLRRALRRS